MNVALFNKDIAPEKIPKINKRTPTFIPESRVNKFLSILILKQERIKRDSKIHVS